MTNFQPLTVKPVKAAFIGTYLIRLGFISAVLAGIYLVITFLLKNSAFNEDAVLLIVVTALFACYCILAVFLIINRFIAYSKEEYLLTAEKIFIKNGGLLYNSEAELIIKNITDFDLKLPFIENTLFNTGHLLIRSAGASLVANVNMVAMKNFQEVYDRVVQLMQVNGFALQEKELVYGTEPKNIGIVLNIFRKTANYFYSGFFLATFALPVILGNLASPVVVALVLFALVAFLSFYVLALGITYLDLKRRKYLIYNDAVVYNKGFLTRHYSVIPVENLSDSASGQTFWQQIFGVFHVQISSKGVATEIAFKNLTDGVQVEKAVDNIIEKFNAGGMAKKFTERAIPAEKVSDNKEGISITESVGSAPVRTLQSVSFKEEDWEQTDFTAETHMQILPALVLPVLGFLVLLGISIIALFLSFSKSSQDSFQLLTYLFLFTGSAGFNIVRVTLKALFTKYFVKENSIREEYHFLSSMNKEFIVKKVTAVIVEQSFADLFFNSVTLKFISVGSATDLSFQHIKYDGDLIKKIKEKFAFNEKDQMLDEIKANYGLIKLLKASAAFIGFLLLTLLGILIFALLINGLQGIASALAICIPIFLAIGIGIFINYVYGIFYHARSRLQIFSDKIIIKKGLLFQSQTHLRLANITSISATRYFQTDCGKLNISFPGGLISQEVQKGKANQYQNATAFRGGQVFLEFLDNIYATGRLLEILQQIKVNKETYDREKLTKGEEKQLMITGSFIINEVWLVYLVSLFIWPLLPFAAVFTLYIYKRKYILMSDKVVEVTGLINITRNSVLFSDINNLQQQQGAFNKLFNTGVITINTSGSIVPRIIVRDIKPYQEFYRLLQENYRK